MYEYIKEFLAFKRSLKDYQKIELKESEKRKLESFDRDILISLKNKAYENLSRDLLNEELGKEYVQGYKHWINHIITYFRKHN